MTELVRDRRFLPAVVAIVIAAFLLVPMISSAPLVNAQSQEAEDPCADVPRSTFRDRDAAAEVHQRSIDCVDFYDISNGDGQGYFRPYRQVSRGQMASFIVQTLEAAGLGDRLPNGDPPDEFNDIGSNTHRSNINILARIGVVRGTSDGRFDPDLLIRRDQMATFLLQAKEWAYETDYQTSNSYFGDVPPSNAHYGNINAAYEQGLVRGTQEPGTEPNSGEYQPGRTVVRQNMASFLVNELKEIVDAPKSFCAPSSPSPSSSARPSTSPSPTATPTSGGGGGGLPIIGGGSPSPSASASPTATASASPTATATASPTTTTSPSPTGSPCARPTSSASPSPSTSPRPSTTPSPRPSATPSATASPSPSGNPSPTPGQCVPGTPLCIPPGLP